MLRVSKALHGLTKACTALNEADHYHRLSSETPKPLDVSQASYNRVTTMMALACIEAATEKDRAELEMARACAEYTATFQARYPERKIR